MPQEADRRTHRFPTFFISQVAGRGRGCSIRRACLRSARRRVAKDARGRRRRAEGDADDLAHREEPVFTVMTHPSPPMLYDYYNFPAFTYEVRYPAPGDPELADRTRALIESAGMAAGVDAERGFDHGMFSPMAVASPKARPTSRAVAAAASTAAPSAWRWGVRSRRCATRQSSSSQQISAITTWTTSALVRRPRRHIRWLVVSTMGATRIERVDASLLEQAPAARAAHPREELLLPLMVAVGAAENESATRVYHEDAFFGGISASSYRFG